MKKTITALTQDPLLKDELFRDPRGSGFFFSLSLLLRSPVAGTGRPRGKKFNQATNYFAGGQDEPK